MSSTRKTPEHPNSPKKLPPEAAEVVRHEAAEVAQYEPAEAAQYEPAEGAEAAEAAEAGEVAEAAAAEAAGPAGNGRLWAGSGSVKGKNEGPLGLLLADQPRTVNPPKRLSPMID
jgi:hypothetical protein